MEISGEIHRRDRWYINTQSSLRPVIYTRRGSIPSHEIRILRDHGTTDPFSMKKDKLLMRRHLYFAMDDGNLKVIRIQSSLKNVHPLNNLFVHAL